MHGAGRVVLGDDPRSDDSADSQAKGGTCTPLLLEPHSAAAGAQCDVVVTPVIVSASGTVERFRSGNVGHGKNPQELC